MSPEFTPEFTGIHRTMRRIGLLRIHGHMLCLRMDWLPWPLEYWQRFHFSRVWPKSTPASMGTGA